MENQELIAPKKVSRRSKNGLAGYVNGFANPTKECVAVWWAHLKLTLFIKKDTFHPELFKPIKDMHGDLCYPVIMHPPGGGE